MFLSISVNIYIIICISICPLVPPWPPFSSRQATVQLQQMVDHSVAAEASPLGRTTPCRIELLRLPQIFARPRGAYGIAVDYQLMV